MVVTAVMFAVMFVAVILLMVIALVVMVDVLTKKTTIASKEKRISACKRKLCYSSR